MTEQDNEEHEYVVSVTGDIVVSAQNREEAEEKAAQAYRDQGGSENPAFQVLGKSGERPDDLYYTAQLINCGSSLRRGDRHMSRKKSALGLVMQKYYTMTKDFVGDDYFNDFTLDFLKHMLARFRWEDEDNNLDKEKLWEDVREIQERLDNGEDLKDVVEENWRIKDPGEVEE